jgi:tight adherence protein B
MFIIISSLVGLSMMGLGYVITKALRAGAETYSVTHAQDTARQFEDIFLFIPPRRIAETGWAAAVTAFLLVFFLTGNIESLKGIALGLILGIIAGGMALQIPRLLFIFLKKRRLRQFNLQLVDTLISMSNALKAGFSITQAFETIVSDGQNPIAQEFSVFIQHLRVGISFTDALNKLEARVASEDLSLMIRSIETARKTGGNLTEMFEKIAVTIRERMRIENRVHTLTAQGRLQGIIVGSMPIVIGVAMTIVDKDMMLPFLRSSIGMVILLTVAVLITCGALVIRKIINIDV